MDSEPEPEGFKAGLEIGPDGQQTGHVICYPSFSPTCMVVTAPKQGAIDSTGFVSLTSSTPFHDEVLIKATAEINAILVKVMTPQEPRKDGLHVVATSDGPMLVWARAMVMPADDIRKTSTMKLG